jgi:hypothetical protein
VLVSLFHGTTSVYRGAVVHRRGEAVDAQLHELASAKVVVQP